MTLCKLLKSKGISQETIAQELNVSMETVQDWSAKEQIPELWQIKVLANILKEHEETLFDVFKPNTHAEKAMADKKEIAWLLKEIFYNIKSPQDLIEFSFFFAVRPSKGAILSRDDNIFFFTKIHWKKDSAAISFSDESGNTVVLTRHNIIKVKPIAIRYDVFMFIVTVNCPVFPITGEKFLPDEFKQEVCILYRKEDSRI